MDVGKGDPTLTASSSACLGALDGLVSVCEMRASFRLSASDTELSLRRSYSHRPHNVLKILRWDPEDLEPNCVDLFTQKFFA